MKKRALNILGLLMIPIILFLLFSSTAKGFGWHSLIIVINQSIVPAAIGMGMCATILAGMVDLSIGVRVVLGAIIGGTLARYFGFVGLVAGCFLGSYTGAIIQATLYRFLKIPSMVLSVGIIMLYEVVAAMITGAACFVKIDRSVSQFGSFPYNIVLILIASLFFYLVMYRTQLGCQIMSVGNNEQLCRSMGVNTDRVKFLSYLVSATICGFAGILQICYSGTISIAIDMTTMSIIFKPLMGALIGMQLVKLVDNLPLVIYIGEVCIQIIFNGLIALGLTDAWQNVVLGAFIVIVMYFTGDSVPTISKIKKSLKRRNEISLYLKKRKSIA